MEQYSSMLAIICRLGNGQVMEKSEYLFELLILNVSEVGEIHFAMIDDEVGQFCFQLLIFMFEDCFFYHSDYCAKSIEIDCSDWMIQERVDELLGVLFIFMALLFEEVSQMPNDCGWRVEMSKYLAYLLLIGVLHFHKY